MVGDDDDGRDSAGSLEVLVVDAILVVVGIHPWTLMEQREINLRLW